MASVAIPAIGFVKGRLQEVKAERFFVLAVDKLGSREGQALAAQRHQEALVPGLDDRLRLVVLDSETPERLREGFVVRVEQLELAAVQRLRGRLQDELDRRSQGMKRQAAFK